MPFPISPAKCPSILAATTPKRFIFNPQEDAVFQDTRTSIPALIASIWLLKFLVFERGTLKILLLKSWSLAHGGRDLCRATVQGSQKVTREVTALKGREINHLCCCRVNHALSSIIRTKCAEHFLIRLSLLISAQVQPATASSHITARDLFNVLTVRQCPRSSLHFGSLWLR